MICSLLISTNAFAEDEIESSALETYEESTAEGIYESIPETFEESVDAFDDVYEDDIYINPVYDNELNESSLTNDIEIYSMRSISNPCYYSWSEVVNAVRQAMTSRSASLTIDYESSEPLATGWLKLLLSDIMEETSSAVEGDYLECHFGGCKSSRKTSQRNGIYHHQLTLTFTYYTTADQEAVVTEWVSKLLKSFNFTSSTSDYDKIKTIYDWLTSNVSYDYTNLNNDSYKLKYSAYAALVNRTSVCQGYTGLAYRLLKESGIDVRIITGTSSGERHAWLIVKLDGLYYNLDPTWDAQQSAYKYFLRGDNNFSNHYRAAEFLTDSFYQRYPMANSNYSYSKSVTKTKEFVTRLYQVCLGRNPDASGLQAWTNQLASGVNTGIQAAYGFVFSGEFLNKNLCNEDYVKLLYKAFLGREADASGLKAWVGTLESGKTREHVFNGFAMSTEFGNLCKEYEILRGESIPEPTYGVLPSGNCSVCGKEDGITGFVTRLYRVCLNREPDMGGLNAWCNVLRSHESSGSEVAYGFIFSSEFINKNLSNEDYVEHLYKAFMGRDSDAAGKSAWIKVLEKGESRKHVFDGFVGSREFTEICNSYGILRD